MPTSVPLSLRATTASSTPASFPISATSVEPKTAIAAAQPVDFSLIADAQKECPDIAAMQLLPSVFSRVVEGANLRGDVSTGVFRLIIPAAFRGNRFLLTCTASTIQVSAPPAAWFVTASAGLTWVEMSQSGPGPACHARKVRSIAMSDSRLPTLLCQLAVLHISTSIWFVRFRCRLVSPTVFTVVDRTTRCPEAFPLSSIADSNQQTLPARGGGGAICREHRKIQAGSEKTQWRIPL